MAPADTTAVVTPVSPVTPVALTPLPTPKPKTDAESPVQETMPAPAVRMGEYVTSPWVDQRGGLRGSGYLIGARDISGIASVDKSRLALYDPVLVSPPVGSVAPEKELFLTYRLGPLIEDLGQIVIPTGLIEVTRSPRNGEPAVGRVVKLFAEMLQGQHLIPFDTTAAMLAAQPSPVKNGKTGRVRWLYADPVLPSLQNYIVLDLKRRDIMTRLLTPKSRTTIPFGV